MSDRCDNGGANQELGGQRGDHPGGMLHPMPLRLVEAIAWTPMTEWKEIPVGIRAAGAERAINEACRAGWRCCHARTIAENGDGGDTSLSRTPWPRGRPGEP